MTTPVAAPWPSARAAPVASGVAVRLDGLSKRFPVRRGWAETLRHPFRHSYVDSVNRVSCDIHTGEFFGLLGPNGAGKTTLFKLLATLILPDEGRATVSGYDIVRDAPQVRRVLAPVIADERSLSWRLTARDNLVLYATLHGIRGREVPRRVDEVLEQVGLVGTGSKMVGAFSSGMKQRLLIARALLARPTILLLDEPTRSLDPVSARRFRQFLREEISGRQKCTVLLATHNAEEAFELCHRVAVLDRGRLMALGTADELARRFLPTRFRVWTRDATHPALTLLREREVIRHVRPVGEAEDWECLEMEIPGGYDRTASVIETLTGRGVRIARFERVTVSLADLIHAILEQGGVGAQHA